MYFDYFPQYLMPLSLCKMGKPVVVWIFGWTSKDFISTFSYSSVPLTLKKPWLVYIYSSESLSMKVKCCWEFFTEFSVVFDKKIDRGLCDSKFWGFLAVATAGDNDWIGWPTKYYQGSNFSSSCNNQQPELHIFGVRLNVKCYKIFVSEF